MSVPALYVWLGMNLLFSWASFGLSGYEWYLTGGFSPMSVFVSRRRRCTHD
jgi:hypothetical protein